MSHLCELSLAKGEKQVDIGHPLASARILVHVGVFSVNPSMISSICCGHSSDNGPLANCGGFWVPEVGWENDIKVVRDGSHVALYLCDIRLIIIIILLIMYKNFLLVCLMILLIFKIYLSTIIGRLKHVIS